MADIVFLDLDLEKPAARAALIQKCAEGYHVLWLEKNLRSDDQHDFSEHMIVLEADAKAG